MTAHGQTPRVRGTRPSGRGRLVTVLLAVLAALLVFLLGIAFSRALDERPRTGEPVTTVRTLEPRTQVPPARTVTETVTQP